MRTVRVSRYEEGAVREDTDVVAEEFQVSVLSNGRELFSEVMTPGEVKEFVYGRLFCVGLIGEKGDVTDLRVEELPEGIRVNVVFEGSIPGNGPLHLENDDTEGKAVARIGSEALAGLWNDVEARSDLHRKTGAFHSGLMFDMRGECLFHSNDIGRHNAADKVIGKLLLAGGRTDDKVLYVTSRINSSMVRKCIRGRIPVLVGRGAVTDRALEMARSAGLGLIGFYRDGRFNVYNGSEAIDLTGP